MSARLGPGIVLNTNNSNSNSNSSNTNSSNSNSSKNSLFSRNSNYESNSNSSSNENEWEEALEPNGSPRANSRLRFATTRKVKRINQSGKSKRLPKGHQTKTRRHYGPNIRVNTNISRNRYAAARLVAAAHKRSYSYDEMKEFIERARTTPGVKLLALHRIKSRYPDFGK